MLIATTPAFELGKLTAQAISRLSKQRAQTKILDYQMNEDTSSAIFPLDPCLIERAWSAMGVPALERSIGSGTESFDENTNVGSFKKASRIRQPLG